MEELFALGKIYEEYIVLRVDVTRPGLLDVKENPAVSC